MEEQPAEIFPKHYYTQSHKGTIPLQIDEIFFNTQWTM